MDNIFLNYYFMFIKKCMYVLKYKSNFKNKILYFHLKSHICIETKENKFKDLKNKIFVKFRKRKILNIVY